VAVPKQRTNSSAQGRRRSHLALKPAQLVAVSNGRMVPRRLKKAAELGLLSNSKKA
jgi:ribosomal protein L32